MGNSYTQIHIQVIFAVKFRASLIEDNWREELYKYITGTFQKNNHKMLAINSMPDHLHLFGGFRPHQALSSIVQMVKAESSRWINEKKLCKERFQWQEGYGGFSYSKDDIDNVVKYILNQQEHHKREEFLAEYRRLLIEAGITFDDQYLFVPPI